MVLLDWSGPHLMWLGYWAQECGLSSSPRSRESQKRDGTPLHVYGISLACYTSEKLRRIGLSRVSVSATESSTRISMKKIVMRISSASYTQSLTTRQCLVCFCGSAADYGRWRSFQPKSHRCNWFGDTKRWEVSIKTEWYQLWTEDIGLRQIGRESRENQKSARPEMCVSSECVGHLDSGKSEVWKLLIIT